jgi:hypothetical protein
MSEESDRDDDRDLVSFALVSWTTKARRLIYAR